MSAQVSIWLMVIIVASCFVAPGVAIFLPGYLRDRRVGQFRLVRDGAGGWWIQTYGDPDRTYEARPTWRDLKGPLTEETAVKILMEKTRERANRKALAQRKPVRRLLR